jgi:hypothetical protein
LSFATWSLVRLLPLTLTFWASEDLVVEKFLAHDDELAMGRRPHMKAVINDGAVAIERV